MQRKCHVSLFMSPLVTGYCTHRWPDSTSALEYTQLLPSIPGPDNKVWPSHTCNLKRRELTPIRTVLVQHFAGRYTLPSSICQANNSEVISRRLLRTSQMDWPPVVHSSEGLITHLWTDFPSFLGSLLRVPHPVSWGCFFKYTNWMQALVADLLSWINLRPLSESRSH